MSSVVFLDTTPGLSAAQQRQKGTVLAGEKIAELVNLEAAKAVPNYDQAFADSVVRAVLRLFINKPNRRATYRNFTFTGFNGDKYTYDENGVSKTVVIKGKPDNPKKLMNVQVPAPSGDGGVTDVLQGYGADVLGDLQALTNPLTNDDAKYFLATVMFRRCR
jgi:hypothetical protein